MSNKPLLQVKGLHTTFTVLKQPLPAVRGVDLRVDEGEILGIVGESGSGKSVTMKSIIRMLPRGAIVTAEEHNIIGGLGEAVCACVSAKCPVPVIRHGVEDQFGRSGAAQKVLEAYGLTPEGIAKKARQAISIKKAQRA